MSRTCPYCGKLARSETGNGAICDWCGKSWGQVPEQSVPVASRPSESPGAIPPVASPPRRKSWSASSERSGEGKGRVGIGIAGAILAVIAIAQRIYVARFGERATAMRAEAVLAERHNAAMASMESFLNLMGRWCRGERVNTVELNEARKRAFKDAETYSTLANSTSYSGGPLAARFFDQARTTSLELQTIAANEAADLVKRVGDGSPSDEDARYSVALSLASTANKVQKTAQALHQSQVDFRSSIPR